MFCASSTYPVPRYSSRASASSEEVVAGIVLDPGAQLDPQSIHDHARESLTAYKVPRRYVVLDELPVNAMGKVLRREVVREIRGR